MEIQLINELIGILEQESKIYDDMLKISKNKTRIIVEGKVTELESIVKLEQSLVMQMGRLESTRENLVDKVSGQLKIKPEELTITELIKYVKDEQKLKLAAYQSGMNNIIKDLKNTNELNSKLIKNSLEFIDFSINLISNADSGVNNYGNTGKTGDGKKRSFFDVKL